MTRRLIRLGWEIEVHAPSGPAAPDAALDPAVTLVRYRAFLPMLGQAARRRGLIQNAGNIVTVDEPLRLLRDRKATIAHLHSGGRLGGAVRTAMRLTDRPYVVSVHGPLLASTEWLKKDTARRMSGVVDLGRPFGFLFGARRVIDDAARVISFNEEERVAIARKVGPRSVRMDHGVDVERLGSGNAEEATRRFPQLGLDQKAPLVLHVGRLCEQKNQLFAIRAFAHGAPESHHLAFVGAATDRGYQERLEREIRERGLEERVHLLGNVAPALLPHLYARAELLLVTSTHEAFGLIVLEGWAANRPVLFPRIGGLADIADALGQGDGASLPSLDEASWVDALRRLTEGEEVRRRNARAGRELVLRRYDWDRIASRVSDLYEDVLREGRAAS
jgi:glycosyltransferase involved in cell wall biosynthesis